MIRRRTLDQSSESELCPVVDRSTTRTNPDKPGGHSMDGSACQRIVENWVDESHHLAKVRVAGSNPVFRSKRIPWERGFFRSTRDGFLPSRPGTGSRRSQLVHTGDVSDPATLYAMSGDLHIAYQVFGEGPFDLVYAPGFISHVEMNWELPYWVNIFRRLSRFSRVIVFDKRGTGLSDRVGGWPTLEERMDDIRAVMDAAGSERAALIGVSEGGPMCMMFAALYPERASALVLRGTGPRFAVGPDWPWGRTMEESSPQLDLAEQNWGTGTVLPYFIQGISDDERAQEETGRFERFAARPGAARQLLDRKSVV